MSRALSREPGRRRRLPPPPCHKVVRRPLPAVRRAVEGGDAIWTTIAATSLGVLAPFLVGTLSVLMRRDFAIGPRDIGIAVGAFFTVAGLAARVLGRTVERIGSARSILVATAVSTTGLLVIAGANHWLVVVFGLVLGGIASAMIHPATAQLLAKNVGTSNLGLAFGLKQSGAPASTMLAGLAIPAIGLWIGWRATFLVAAAVVIILGSVVVRTVHNIAERGLADLERPQVVSHTRLPILALGAGLGTAAGNALGVLLVDGGVRFSGVTESTAGYVLAGVSAAAILTRIVLGRGVDVGWLDGSRLLVWMPALGVVGAGFLALPTVATFVVGAALAYPIGWGWSGLLHYCVVSPHRDSAARLTGVLMTGFSLGAAAGPLALGIVAQQTSYRVTWIATAVLFALAAVTMSVGRVGLGTLDA